MNLLEIIGLSCLIGSALLIAYATLCYKRAGKNLKQFRKTYDEEHAYYKYERPGWACDDFREVVHPSQHPIKRFLRQPVR